MIPTSVANDFGCLALVAYTLTIVPGHCRVLMPDLFKVKALGGYLKNPNLRRNLGILAFFLAIAHAVPIILHRRWDVADPKTYASYFHGVLVLIIFAALAATSNRWSQKGLKKDWKKLHELTYTALFLLTWHVIGAMWGKWDHLTVLMIAIMVAMCGLFIVRKWIERHSKAAKATPRPSPALGGVDD